ncbi:type III secretion protein [Paracidovorax anthurii]|uniref:Type III secretion inner rod protein HrpB2 n=1 Tax=Paracidovorax anthurii TaxID=78229 RepID=A0A328YUV3_9BURK|nr:type III secretion protein [Paracidovorax anthurii]RAR77801.1 type III secretion inner rod protein HrpB2 [Paracidovorax anthurii]WCM93629.1 type III secretion protein [Acidovorax sp. NCPPB 2350]
MNALQMPVIPTSAIEPGSASSSPMSALAEKFARLMEGSPQTPLAEMAPDSTLGNALMHQDESMRKTIQDMHALAHAQKEGLNDIDTTSRQIELMYRVSGMQFQFHAMVYLAQSSKSGLQTLMRNQ